MTRTRNRYTESDKPSDFHNVREGFTGLRFNRAWMMNVIVPAILVLIGIAAAFFGVWLAAWLFMLSVVTTWRPWVGASAFFATVSLDLVKPVFGGIFVSFSELAFSACLLGWLLFTVQKSVPMDWRALKWGVPFSGAVLISALVNNQLIRVFPHVLRASELMVAILLCSNVFGTEKAKANFRWALAATAIFYSLAGIWQFPSVPGWRVYSYFSNPNQLGGYLNLLLPVVLVQSWLTSSLGRRLLWCGVFLVAFLAAVAAQSRASLMAFAVATAIVTISYYRKSTGRLPMHPAGSTRAYLLRLGPLLMIGIIVIAAIAAIVGIAQSRTVSSAWKVLVEREVLSQRYPYFIVGLTVWKDHPLVGVGPGNFPETVDCYPELLSELGDNLSEYSEFPRLVYVHVHNLYLQLSVDYGLLGLAGFLWLMGRLLLEFFGRRAESTWCLAGIGVLSAFLIHNLFDVTYPSLAMETGLMIGVLLPPPGKQASEDGTSGRCPLA